jgi:hypothetical protein
MFWWTGQQHGDVVVRAARALVLSGGHLSDLGWEQTVLGAACKCLCGCAAGTTVSCVCCRCDYGDPCDVPSNVLSCRRGSDPHIPRKCYIYAWARKTLQLTWKGLPPQPLYMAWSDFCPLPSLCMSTPSKLHGCPSGAADSSTAPQPSPNRMQVPAQTDETAGRARLNTLDTGEFQACSSAGPGSRYVCCSGLHLASLLCQQTLLIQGERAITHKAAMAQGNG